MVIFLFLRSLWATIIPSVAVPLALLGACALMWVAGYSLDNLSLMALTIWVGFVVDDAIVMLEKITRYVEEGEEPFAAALRASREIAFTIVSISVSLIAVLIPLLLMGGIIGRLFREFAVTLSMTIAESALVSLTLTPMMASRSVAHVAMSIGGTGNALNAGRLFITLKPRGQRTATADQIIARLGPQLDKVEGAKLFMQVAQDLTIGGRASRTQFQYTLQGSDPDALNVWAPKMLAKLQTLSELRDVATDQQTAGATLTLTFDRDEASRYGLTAQTIDDTLYDAFGQRQIAQYFTQLSSYEVIMEVLPSLQDDLATLDRIFLKSPATGGDVSLSDFAKWTTTPIQPLSISHQGQFPAVTISFNLAPGVALGQATDAVQRARDELQLPATIIASFQGNAQAFQDSLSTVWLLILGALVVVYLILGILYESYIHPITIISTLLATLMLFHFDFSLIALIGIILLIGIVKKNGIMLVDFAMVAERDDQLSAEDAVRRAALLRFRPILMTTMAAMLGGVPLMLGTGAGSELRQPLGYAIVGGLLVSQALTLFTTPVIYIYLDRLSDWISSWRSPAPNP